MDNIDRKILSCLQEDSTMHIEAIAERVGLSASPCWRRIRKLEDMGYIAARVALLDSKMMNVCVTVFVMVRASKHQKDWDRSFCTAMAAFPEVMEMHRTSGTSDYILKVVVPDVAAFNKVYQAMIDRFEYLDITSTFSMDQIKHTTSLPVTYAK
jgi:Lrp/AsnC family transcriptional regulator